MATPSKGQPAIESKVMKITPKLAEEWLGKNTRNRPLRQGRAEALAEAIKRGEWVMNGDAIRFDVNGDLSDGQHRLWAVIEAGVPVESLVITGLPVEAQETMDMGARRSLKDALVLRGHKNASSLAAVVTYFYRYTNGQIRNPSFKPTVAQAVALLDEHPNLGLYTARAKTLNQRFRVSSSMVSVAWYEFASIDEAEADAFFEALIQGVGLEEGSPILALRRWFERQAMGGGAGTRSGAIVVAHALVIKAWNAWRDGVQVAQLNWKSGGLKAEAFPEPH